VHFPIEPGRDAAITTEGQEVNNWTMVLPILWYRSGNVMRKMKAESLSDLVSMVHGFAFHAQMGANLTPNLIATLFEVSDRQGTNSYQGIDRHHRLIDSSSCF
jgi:hypothetical protein